MGRERYLILVVDDDIGSLQLFGLILTRAGYDVITACAAEAAFPLLELFPDLILSDITMPGMWGYEFFEVIKANRDLDQIRFAFITTRCMAEDVARGLAMQVDDYIALPVGPVELLECVESMLAQPVSRRWYPGE